MTVPDLPPLVLCSFGTSVPEARETYDRFEQVVRQRFPDHEVRWAYTSSLIRRELARQGLAAFGPLDALAGLFAAGHHSAVVQPLYVTPGQEFEQLLTIKIPNMRLVFGRPLLDKPADIDLVLEILLEEMKPDVPNVFVAHGNSGKFDYNLPNLEFAKRLRHKTADTVLASLEGEPGTKPLDAIRLAVARAGKVHFIPMLFVAGDHVAKDVMGDGPNSWKNRLKAASATCNRPLGENPKIVEMFLNHIATSLKSA